ncbi:MAG: hypothetical protein Athens071416_340 [Parcubacteria group bacterium Athens0714_16]|nr:MAG: hypothetical protein Athens071416_340 [Parcubacteria group bacterium Athens0714_16]
MVVIKAYQMTRTYISKCGEKLDKSDTTGIFASVMSGRKPKDEKELVYVACGETEDRARKSLGFYLYYINFGGKITEEEKEEVLLRENVPD